MYTVILMAGLALEPMPLDVPGCHGQPARSTTVQRSYQLVPQAPKLVIVERRITTTVRAACAGSARTGLLGRLRERGGLFRGGCR